MTDNPRGTNAPIYSGSMTTQPMPSPLPCAFCGRQLESAITGERNQPYGAVRFQGHGGYGSQFDPMDGSYLEVNVCEPCLTRASKRARVLLVKPGPPVERTYEYERWEP